MTNKPALDSAKAILLPIQDQLETRYDADQLRLFEGLLNLAYQGKVLTPKSYGQLKAWLVDIYEQMEDDVIVKDLFEKVFYGIAYEALDGTLHYYANAQNERLFERKSELEAEGITVSPIFAKAYYYNLRYNVSHAREDFNRYLAKIMDQSYLDKVKEIKALPSALDEEAFRQKQDLAASNYGEKAAEALGQYGRIWHIQNQG